MDANQSSNNRNLWIALAALAIGLVIGLVVLGWWLFPVQWTDAAPSDLLPDYQVDYLQAAIDSFALTFDSNAALQRYEDLGEGGPPALATVQADPGASPTAVAAYSQLVTVGEQEGYVEEPAQEGLGDVGKILIALLLIVLVAALLVWLMFRGRGQEPAGETPPVEPEPPPAVAETPPAVVEEPVSEEIPAEEVPAEGDTHPVQVAGGDTQPVTTTPEEPPPPMWLPEEEPEPDREEGRPGLGIAGLAAAGLAAAASSETDEDTSETPLEGDDTHPLAVAALASAAGLEETPEETAPVTIEELTGVEPEMAAAAMAIASTEDQAEVEEPSLVEESDRVEDQTEAEIPSGAAVYEAAQMGYELAYIEGIGPVYAEKLVAIGITTPGELLEQGATPRGRQAIAEQSGISGRLILEWVNHVDLFRVKGIGSEYADLLEAAGVDTVVELAMRNPDHLHQAMLSVNESKQLVRKPPVLAQVQDWVEQAKNLPRKIYY